MQFPSPLGSNDPKLTQLLLFSLLLYYEFWIRYLHYVFALFSLLFVLTVVYTWTKILLIFVEVGSLNFLACLPPMEDEHNFSLLVTCRSCWREPKLKVQIEKFAFPYLMISRSLSCTFM